MQPLLNPLPYQSYDAIVIGAGLGGLLSAAQLIERGQRVAVLERLPHAGGRFTAKTFQGAQVSTGAVHMVPFGSSGALAAMLRSLHIPHRLLDADLFGSFHVHGKQVQARGLLGVSKFLGPRQFFWFTRIGYLMFFAHLPVWELPMPFDVWLARHIDTRRNRELVAFFERISRFALSLELSQVTTAEVIRTTKNMLLFGAPGIVEGGCAALTSALEQRLLVQGVDLRLRCEVMQILLEDGQVSGVRVRDKASGAETLLLAPLVVSDIGPRATDALRQNRQVTQAQVLKKQHGEAQALGQEKNLGVMALLQPEHASQCDGFQEAIGLKTHVLSDVSLIPHRGIMYCLDTQRIAGIVQPTNFDPRLAPPGKHLIISHQVMQSANVAEEKELALADLRLLFGETFEKHCRVLTISAYRGEWPVNRALQGEDVKPVSATKGLYLVGDAVKPPGFLMVEGVAQSVNQLLAALDEGTPAQRDKIDRHTARKKHAHGSGPSRLNALRWLWKAPGNAGKEKPR